MHALSTHTGHVSMPSVTMTISACSLYTHTGHVSMPSVTMTISACSLSTHTGHVSMPSVTMTISACSLLYTYRTCFYALCLIAKTPQGANTLLESNWTSVRHSLEEKWPLVFDPNFELSDDITSSDEFSSTKRPFNVHPAPFIQSPFDITSPNRTLTYKSFSGDKFETLPGRVAALGREPVEQAQGEVKFQTAIPSSVLQLKKTGIQHRPLRKTDSTKSEIVQLSEWSRRGAFSSSKKRRFAKDRSSSFVRSEKQTMSRRSQRSPMREMKSPPRPKSLSSADMLDSPADDRGRR